MRYGGPDLLRFQEHERIGRQIGHWKSVALALANQSLVLLECGLARKALPLAEEAYRIVATYGYLNYKDDFQRHLTAVRQAAASQTR